MSVYIYICWLKVEFRIYTEWDQRGPSHIGFPATAASQLISGHLQGHKRFQIPYRPKSVSANKASEYSPLSLLCGHREGRGGKKKKQQPGSLKMYEINAGDRAQLQKKEEEGNKGRKKKKQRKLCLWKFCGVLFLVKLLFASRASNI